MDLFNKYNKRTLKVQDHQGFSSQGLSDAQVNINNQKYIETRIIMQIFEDIVIVGAGIAGLTSLALLR